MGGLVTRTERLFKIQPGIAKGLIPQAELIFRKLHTATEALCDAKPLIVELACKFQTDAVEGRVLGRVDGEAGGYFGYDGAKVTSFDTLARSEGAGAA